jgi:hypothetical protein
MHDAYLLLSQTDGNIASAEFGQTAKCDHILDKNAVKITVHKPVPVEADIRARGYWCRDSDYPNQQIMKVSGNRGGRTIILLGTVMIPDQTPRPESWKDLTAEDIEGITTGEPWRRYTYVSVNLL